MSEATFTEKHARDRLARLERCKSRGIKPVPGGEQWSCANDQIELEGEPFRHSDAEVQALQEMAGRSR